MAGWERIVEVSGNANAHFNFRRGRSSACKPASLADWKRVFVRPPPQLDHAGPSFPAAADLQEFASSSGRRAVVAAGVPRKVEIFKRSSAESGAACAFITPPSSVL